MARRFVKHFAALAIGFLSIGGVASYPLDAHTYDYIVIGSGPGGGPLAANLARRGHSVLLLEAGEDRGDELLQRLPSFADRASETPGMSWGFFVQHHEDQEQARRDSKFTYQLRNGSYYVGRDPPQDAEPLGIFYPRGATVGGSGQVNAMNFALPPDNDWDNIAEITGDESWRSANMRHYYQRLEDCQYRPPGTPSHGFDGYIDSNRNDFSLLEPQEGFLDIMRSANAANGDPSSTNQQALDALSRDLNRLDPRRYEQEGLYALPLHTTAHGERSGSRTYLIETTNATQPDGTSRYQLTLSTLSFATRVLFSIESTTSPRAIGVEYLRGEGLYSADPRYNASVPGSLNRAYARKEVIVSGGVFNTPQILKLSGIGPQQELESHNIPVLVDLRGVGANMQDNYEGGVTFRAAQNFTSVFADCTFLEGDDPCLDQFFSGNRGPYSLGGAPAGMLHRSSVSENSDTDLFYFGAAGTVFRGYFPGYSREVVPYSSFFWSIVKMQTQNRAGTVRLRSGDPREAPEIRFNYFAQGGNHDLTALEEGVQFALRIFDETQGQYGPFQRVEPHTDVSVRQGIMDEVFGHHATSTCSIGNEDDHMACVDSRFRVRGVEGLRVVDASVFPRSPGGFPVAPTFMISEKATDVILEDLRAGQWSRG